MYAVLEYILLSIVMMYDLLSDPQTHSYCGGEALIDLSLNFVAIAFVYLAFGALVCCHIASYCCCLSLKLLATSV